MYNRYIPQGDGSYKRKTIQENIPSKRNAAQKKSPQNSVSSPEQIYIPPRSEEAPVKNQCRECHNKKERKYIPEISAGSFLKDLLPKDLDTGDLLIIVLLLLISADNSDDQGSALLTLALYLFM